MKICPNCSAQSRDTAAFCTKCGASLKDVQPVPAEASAQPQPEPQMEPQMEPQLEPQMQPIPEPQAQYQQQYQQQQQYQAQPQQPDPSDHTADFEADDISSNKVVAMAAYLLGTLGIIISLLAAKESPYASFHSRQALKLVIVEKLLEIITLALCWTIIVPVAGAVCLVIVLVLRIICFFQVASGKAKDAPLIGAFPFLK